MPEPPTWRFQESFPVFEISHNILMFKGGKMTCMGKVQVRLGIDPESRVEE
jgi:hypothetical protein